MQKRLPLREVDTSTAREFAEALLTQRDLQHSLASLTLWTQKSAATDTPDPETRTVLGSLFRDGIILFTGCFDKTKHPLTLTEVYPNVKGADAYLKWMTDLRNSYAAHRYGAARQCVVGVMVDPDLGYAGYGHFAAVYHGPQRSGHQDLLSFVSMAVRFVDAKVASLGARFDAEARAMSLDELLKAPLAGIHGLGPEEMGMSRGQLKKDRQDQKPD